VILQRWDVAAEHLLHQARHDLDTGEIAAVHGAIKRLPGEGLLMDSAIGVTVEEAAHAVFQLVDALGGGFDQRPGQFLIVEVRTALDGVPEVLVQRVARV
jgi:hypothetical protein